MSESHDGGGWKVRSLLEKFDGRGRLVARRESHGNLVMFGGWSCMLECLIGNGTGTGGQTLTYFNNANAHLGWGDSSTAADATHTDLQAAINKMREPMDATYPQHTDGTVTGSRSIVFKATAEAADANWAWNEWGVFNGLTGGRMLNRKVEALGTKASPAEWAHTITITLT